MAACRSLRAFIEHHELLSAGEMLDEWRSLAGMADDDICVDEYVDLLGNADLPPYCSLEWLDGELTVTPSVEAMAYDDVPTGDELPDDDDENYGQGALFAVVSDHGNVTLYSLSVTHGWQEVWAIV